jgi:Xaa-Pro aminopeptidase
MIRLILTLLIALQAAVCTAKDNAFFAARREALMKRMDGAVAVLQGAPSPRAYIPFRQDNNFYYLTGVEVPGSLLLLDAAQHHAILFLPSKTKDSEPWEGKVLSPGSDARTSTGIDAVMGLSRFEEELEKRKSTLTLLYLLRSPHETSATSRDLARQHDRNRKTDSWDGRESREFAFEQNVRSKLNPSVLIKDLSPILDEMRRVKDALEIERMREAGRIGALGMKEAMRSAKPDMFEYQLAALAQSIFLWHGAFGYAYYPIVGSGANSCILHYVENQRKMIAGDIVVMDFGPDLHYYGTDITRTFPVSGKFTEEQARVYQAVLAAQNAALEKIRPGATMGDIEAEGREVLARLGYDKYLTHGMIHYVGMSVHDVGLSEPLEPGVVVALEPGVYMTGKNLGVRIEDTVLVTRDGYEILTRDAPKSIEEIEKLMAEKGLSDAIRD